VASPQTPLRELTTLSQIPVGGLGVGHPGKGRREGRGRKWKGEGS